MQSTPIKDIILGNIQQVENLLSSGFDINAYDDSGETLLINAVKHDKFETIAFLLEQGADINQGDRPQGKTPLMYVIEMDNQFIIDVLTYYNEAGIYADIYQKDKNGICSLSYVLAHSDASILARIMNYSWKDSDFFEFGRDSALAYAIRTERKDILELFFREIKNKDCPLNCDALLWAAYMGKERMLIELIENEVDIDSFDNHGNSALMLAASEGQLTSLQLLLERGADVNWQNSNCDTALICATKKNNVNTVEALLEDSNIVVQITNNDNLSALDYARKHNYFEIENFLLQHLLMYPRLNKKDI